jgi:hypothetical protein
MKNKHTPLPKTMRTIDWFVTAATLRSAFEEKHRDNGSSFWACTDQVGDSLQKLIRDLHDDELPNDWRYQTIVGILDAIVEMSEDASTEWLDASSVIADRLTSVWTSELAAWIGENGNRASYHDDAMAEGLICGEVSLHDRLAVAQYQCIRPMADQILSVLGLI